MNRTLLLAALALLAAGCAKESAPGEFAQASSLAPPPFSAAASRAPVDGSLSPATPASAPARLSEVAPLPTPLSQLEPDGNDDPEDPGAGRAPASGHFERIGVAPLSLQRICDLTPFQGSLYAAHANQPLGTDGATISRYTPVPGADAGTSKKSAFRVAFDWNRPGEPTAGGGAGQGFLRIRAIGGRLFVPDADPPYDGFHIADHGTEGYVFVSDETGAFAKPAGPHYHPPPPPTADGGAGASVLPRAYHDLDVIRFRGRLYASTGAVPPKERAWHGPSPGALLVVDSTLSRFNYEVDYPFPWQNGVWRLGFMVRFRDRLFAGIQDYDGRDPNDYVVFSPDPAALSIRHEDMQPKRVTDRGGSLTLRWYTDRGLLYWISLSRNGEGALRVSSDGETWRLVSLPEGTGRPTDITRFRDALVVLTERGLYRLEGDEQTALLVADVTEAKTPFALDDFFCAAPLAVFEDELYAGGQRRGDLYRLVEGGALPAR